MADSNSSVTLIFFHGKIVFITVKTQHIYVSGGATHQGVGICISAHLVSECFPVFSSTFLT